MLVIVKIALRSIVYLLLGGFIFLNLINFMQFSKARPLKIVESKSIDEKHKLEDDIKTLEVREKKIIEEILKEQFKLKREKIEKISWYKTFNIQIPQYVFFTYLKDKNRVVGMLYLIIMMTFLLQVFLLSLSHYYVFLSSFISEKKLDNFFLSSSEWAVNTPPVLGVVGTMIAFGMVVSNLNDMNSLSTLFKQNFATATLTTIIGGVTYTLNFFVNIFISSNLTKG